MTPFYIFPLFILIALTNAFASTPTLPKAPYLSPQEVKNWQAQKKVIIVDVREPQEYEAGHIDGAINIPYRDIEPRAKEINFEDTYVFYCIHSSWRAPYAANFLADQGHANVYILEGGIAAWNAGGQVIYSSVSDQEPSVAVCPVGLERVLKHPSDQEYKEKRCLTLSELSYFDGKDGHPAYVAVEGVIYDVTNSRLWRGGVHDPSHGMAAAGRDLTEVLKESPHGDKHLKDFPVVGWLVNSKLK